MCDISLQARLELEKEIKQNDNINFLFKQYRKYLKDYNLNYGEYDSFDMKNKTCDFIYTLIPDCLYIFFDTRTMEYFYKDKKECTLTRNGKTICLYADEHTLYIHFKDINFILDNAEFSPLKEKIYNLKTMR
jgi:hypothetical protein